MQPINLTDLERRSWRAMNQDGLLDILFGFMLLGASVSALVGLCEPPDWLRIVSLSAIQFGGVFWMIWARRRYVVPRVGHVKFSERRVRKTRITRMLLAACVGVTVLLVVLTALSSRLGFSFIGEAGAWGAWGVISAVILVPIAAIAVFLDVPRLVLHGSLFVLVEFFLVVVGLEDASRVAPALLYGAASAISFSIGIPIFVRFLRNVPRASLPKNGGLT